MSAMRCDLLLAEKPLPELRNSRGVSEFPNTRDDSRYHKGNSSKQQG